MPAITMTGDACGLGETRKRELVKACRVLGVKEVRVRALGETIQYRCIHRYIRNQIGRDVTGYNTQCCTGMNLVSDGIVCTSGGTPPPTTVSGNISNM